MIKIWLNHWFSTAYNIINLIKQDSSESFYIIGSSRNCCAVYQNVCDEWYSEPDIDEESYVKFCLDFCKEKNIDVFLPRRNMVIISKHKSEFENIGVKVMVDSYDKISVLNSKAESYKILKNLKSFNIPEYFVVTDAEQFYSAYNSLKQKYSKICFKFEQDEGGQSFRVINDTKNNSLFEQHNSHITFNDAFETLSKMKGFPSIIVMPFLSGNEVSVDCLNTSTGRIMIPRVKDSTRAERIVYDNEILNMCIDFFDFYSLECPFNIQFRYLDGIPYLLEVNTRMSGGVQMSCLASGVNIPDIAVNKLLGIEKSWTMDYTEKVISYIETPLIIG